jgi:polyisoprenoid-binding protein YceI
MSLKSRTIRLNLPVLALIVVVSLALVACAPEAAPTSGAAPVAQATTASAPEPTSVPVEEAAGEPAGLPVGEQVYIIDPSASTASYIADEEFFADALTKYGIGAGRTGTVGSTQAIEGSFTLNWSDLSASLGENTFTVDLSTLTSDQSLRDGWLRNDGPRFGQYPNAIFVASGLQDAPSTYNLGDEVTFNMVGELTIREITQPATFAVTASLSADGVVTGVALADATMSDFGITPPNFLNTLTVADEFQIRVEFTARSQ